MAVALSNKPPTIGEYEQGLKRPPTIEEYENLPSPIFKTTPDPSGLTGSVFRGKSWVKPKTIKRYVGKPLRTGLGVISWPFERASVAVGTPYRALLKERAEVAERHRASEIIPAEEQLASIFKTLKEPAKIVGKAFISKELPEEAVTIPEVVAEDLMPNAPGWMKIAFGLGAEFAVTPGMVGGALRGITKGAGFLGRVTGVTQKVQAYRLPAWQRMKLRARMKTGARVERAAEVTQPLRGKQVAFAAKELGARVGKPIGKKAVEARLGQIVKGGITEQPALQRLANPAIQEFVKTSGELKRLGILPAETYITRLPRRRIAELLQKKAKLQVQLGKVKEAPYRHALLKATEKLKIQGKEKLADDLWRVATRIRKQNPELGKRLSKTLEIKTTQPQTLLNFLTRFEKAGLKERARIIDQLETIGLKVADQKITGLKPLINKIKGMKKRFPGRAKVATGLENQIDDIARRVQESYKYGGTRYFPRMYTSVEEAQAARRFPLFGGKRIRAQYAKRRKEIPLEVRKKMGEITSPAYPVRKRLIQSGADIETAKLFQQVASRPAWVGSIWREGLKKTRLPNTKAYGALRNMFVNPRVYDDVTELVRIRGNFENLYDTFIGSWKLFKVTFSPSTQFRNKFSNKVLLDISGVGYAEQAKQSLRFFKEWRGNTKEYQLIKRYFARTTFVKGELLDDVIKANYKARGTGLGRAIDSMRRGVAKAAEKPSAVYQHEEFISKAIKYYSERDKGRSVIQAIEAANKAIFDYGDLTRWEKLIARRLMPFYTFPRKALPRVAEAIAERPYTVAKYPLFAKMMTQHSLYKLDMSNKDYTELHKTLPEYMQTGSYILMPYRDKNGDLRFFDWTYMVPWGEIAEVQQRGALKSVVTNPLVTLFSDITQNKSGWSGRAIWEETDTPAEQWAKKVQYIWVNLVPSLAYKGLYWDKIIEAAEGKPTTKPRLLPETFAHTIFGLRTQPIDEEKQYEFFLRGQKKKLDEIETAFYRLEYQLDEGRIDQEEYDKKQAQYYDQIDKVLKEME